MRLEGTGEPVDGPDGADIPITVSILTTGNAPDLMTVPLIEGELKALQAWIDRLDDPLRKMGKDRATLPGRAGLLEG